MRAAAALAVTLAFSGAACGVRKPITPSGAAGGDAGAAGTTGAAVAAGTPDDAGIAGTGGPDSGQLGPWKSTADYPLAAKTCAGSPPGLYCAGQTCVASSGYVYCVGGASDSTYFAPVSAAGMGPWTQTTNYPVVARDQSCVVEAGIIYCVGGRLGGTDGGAVTDTANAYFAPLSATGIGDWKATTAFPGTDVRRCVASGGYLYCLSETPHYAPLAATGIGKWVPTQGPPTNTNWCAAVGGYVYCFGGGICSPSPPGDCYGPSHYAPLTAAGVGDWKTTTPLPTAVSAKFASAGSFLYYLGIPVFVAHVSSSGIGPWETTTNYPRSLYPETCFSSADHVYCSNPISSSSYFAQIGAANPSALHLVNPPSVQRSEYLVPALNHGEGASVGVNGVMAGAPQYGKDIDDAVIFDCAAAAATPSGCQTTVVSPEDTAYNYDMTIWYPCAGASTATTNCCYLPKLGYSTPFNAWCASTDKGSFIITHEINLR